MIKVLSIRKFSLILQKLLRYRFQSLNKICSNCSVYYLAVLTRLDL
jgi:hypothetical protein